MAILIVRKKQWNIKTGMGVDGVMIGRAAIGYPWIFNEIKHFIATGLHLHPPTIEQRVDVIRKHLGRSVEWKGFVPGINEMRRHYTNYLKGLPNIREYRTKLVTAVSREEIDQLLFEMKIPITDTSLKEERWKWMRWRIVVGNNPQLLQNR
jgi:tRNA-dihydrouridine synthase